jgi:UDP-galactopyranose mutase
MAAFNVGKFISWYYTPMALQFSHHLKPVLTVYDCMDELSAFKNAPKILGQLEYELFSRANLIFTGGHSLFEQKRKLHYNVHAFPSSIDRHHFQKARAERKAPEDQSQIPSPRFGFYGVIDERLDLSYVEAVAKLRPDWHFIFVGPIAKIDPEQLPKGDNIHYLGQKHYDQLPEYLASWDVAIMPFARNESTEFISPTKTPEYLAGGKPVISTSVRDVVKPYGENKLVHIADTPEAFVEAAEQILSQDAEGKHWLKRVDEFLEGNSWDETWNRMCNLIEKEMRKRDITGTTKNEAYV